MPADYVVDASAIAKLFLDEPGADRFRDRWYGMLGTGRSIAAPHLLRHEVGHLIVRNLTTLDVKGRRRAWREALAGVHFTDEGLEKAFDIQGVTFYDAAYIAVAHHHKAVLITFHTEMAKAARRHGVAVERPH